MNKKDINNNESIQKITVKLALPAITEMLLQTFMGVADTAMVGSLGGYAIAAVSLSDNPIMVMLAFFAAISVGTTALVARFVGAKEHKNVKYAITQSLYLSIFFSIIFTIGALFLSKNIVVWMGAEKDVIPFAITYLRIILLGLPALIITMIMSGALRGAGDTKTPMIVNGLSNIINVICNFILIFNNRTISFNIPLLNKEMSIFLPGANLGVTGAAIATTLGRIIALILILKVLFSKNNNYKITLFKDFKIDFSILKRILKVGMPAAGEQLIFRFAQLVFFRMVASLGTVMVAAHKIALTAESLSFMPGWGFALAATTLVGQSLGEDDPDKAKKGGYTAAYMACIVMTAFGVLFFLFPKIFIIIFTRDSEIINNAVICLQLVALSQPFLAATMVFAGALRGAGDTKIVLVITTMTAWGIRVGLGYYLAFTMNLGLAGAWAAMALDLTIRGIVFFIIFKRGKWQKIKV
ncbi:MATE family efflux transporter [Clostridium sediminicola]|uniref:MATE family efflux transporter n=1 Tax=Clostridium sediminicola TaxID=3114879 RepID=UPI0031F27941